MSQQDELISAYCVDYILRDLQRLGSGIHADGRNPERWCWRSPNALKQLAGSFEEDIQEVPLSRPANDWLQLRVMYSFKSALLSPHRAVIRENVEEWLSVAGLWFCWVAVVQLAAILWLRHSTWACPGWHLPAAPFFNKSWNGYKVDVFYTAKLVDFVMRRTSRSEPEIHTHSWDIARALENRSSSLLSKETSAVNFSKLPT